MRPPHKSSERRVVAVVHTHPGPIIKALQEHGFTGLACPALEIIPVPHDLNPKDYDVAILTSAHAIPAAVKACLSVIVVGKQCAQAATKAGLDVLGIGNGHVTSLKDIKMKRAVHLCGRDLAPGTAEVMRALGAAGVCVYEARALQSCPSDLASVLSAGELHAVMMFSARGAQAFTDMVKQGTNLDLWRGVRGVALSKRIASAMAGVPYTEILVAAHPDRNAILEVLVS